MFSCYHLCSFANLLANLCQYSVCAAILLHDNGCVPYCSNQSNSQLRDHCQLPLLCLLSPTQALYNRRIKSLLVIALNGYTITIFLLVVNCFVRQSENHLHQSSKQGSGQPRLVSYYSCRLREPFPIFAKSVNGCADAVCSCHHRTACR